jgi:hypothetical protein
VNQTSAQRSLAGGESDDSDDSFVELSHEESLARFRLVRKRCPGCSGKTGTRCSACGYCPSHCERLTVCD